MSKHIPVLLEEAVRLWALDEHDKVRPGIYVDATFGGGGHSIHLLNKTSEDVIIVGIDRDNNQIQKSNVKFQREIRNKRLFLVNSNFVNISEIVSSFQKKQKLVPGGDPGTRQKVRGVLFDFGIATDHLSAGRGFSFQEVNDPLDMRFDPIEDSTTAADILNNWREEELVKIFQEYGEERYARKVAYGIARSRQNGKVFTTVADLLEDLEKVLASSYRKQKIHYATRVFQALRIAVNNEYENIEWGLVGALNVLSKGGRIAAISFHSGEDRIVKNFFRRENRDCLCPPNVPSCVCGHRKSLQIITRKPLTPSAEEIQRNPSARSAKLRAAEKI